MHDTHATTPHATLACDTDKTSCTTKLTRCDEGSTTREGNTWWGDITQERKEGQQMHKMGQVSAPHPCHNPSRNPRMHCRQNLLHNRPHKLRRRNHNTGGKYVAGTHKPREKKKSAGAQDGAGLCTTPMPQSPHATIACATDKSSCHTHLTGCGEGSMTRETLPKRERKVSKCTRWGGYVHPTHATTPHATNACGTDKTSCTTVLTSCDEGTITREGSTWRGHISQERKKSQQVHKMGQVCAPHPCHNPSRNHRMRCQQNLLHNQTHSL